MSWIGRSSQIFPPLDPYMMVSSHTAPTANYVLHRLALYKSAPFQVRRLLPIKTITILHSLTVLFFYPLAYSINYLLPSPIC